MIMDTNKCIACQTCTVACKCTWTWGKGQEYMLWNNIETKPFGFYPTGWDVNVLDQLGPQSVAGRYLHGPDDLRGRPCRRAPSWAGQPDEEDWNHPNLGEDEPTGDVGEHAVRRRRCRTRYVDVLPPADLQPLHVSGVPCGLPS